MQGPEYLDEFLAEAVFEGDPPGVDPAREGEYNPAVLAEGTNLVGGATRVTDGDLLGGVRFFGGGARTHSLVMGYQSKEVRFIDTVHMFDRDKPPAVRL